MTLGTYVYGHMLCTERMYLEYCQYQNFHNVIPHDYSNNFHNSASFVKDVKNKNYKAGM